MEQFVCWYGWVGAVAVLGTPFGRGGISDKLVAWCKSSLGKQQNHGGLRTIKYEVILVAIPHAKKKITAFVFGYFARNALLFWILTLGRVDFVPIFCHQKKQVASILHYQKADLNTRTFTGDSWRGCGAGRAVPREGKIPLLWYFNWQKWVERIFCT